VDRSASYCLLPSGFAILRNGDGPTSTYLNLSFGAWAGWHSHFDTLSLNLRSHGQVLLEEMARFGGYGEALSVLFRAPESHNQLTVDGMHFTTDAAHRAGRDPLWASAPAADFFTAWHSAYRHHDLEPQTLDLALRRTVLFVKDPGYAVVCDVAWIHGEAVGLGEGPDFAITQNWHSPAPFTVEGLRSARTTGDPACLLTFARPELLRRLEPGVDYAGAESPRSVLCPERYHLRARLWRDVEYRGAQGLTVLLYPFAGTPPQSRSRRCRSPARRSTTRRPSRSSRRPGGT